MSYKPFVIIGQERTGSTFLQMILHGNPGIVCFGEIFNPSKQVRMKSRGSGRIIGQDDDAVQYLKDSVFTSYPGEVQAVGFRLFYTHCRNGRWGELWRNLIESDVSVIHLKRRNLLDRHLSHEMALRTDVWLSMKGDVGRKQEAIRLDPKKCFEDIAKSEWYHDHIAETFGTHLMLEIFYEDLCDDFLATCIRLQDFVGVKLNNIETRMQRQRTRPREEMIKNYDELKDQVRKGITKEWARPEWISFFDDESL